MKFGLGVFFPIEAHDNVIGYSLEMDSVKLDMHGLQLVSSQDNHHTVMSPLQDPTLITGLKLVQGR